MYALSRSGVMWDSAVSRLTSRVRVWATLRRRSTTAQKPTDESAYELRRQEGWWHHFRPGAVGMTTILAPLGLMAVLYGMLQVLPGASVGLPREKR